MMNDIKNLQFFVFLINTHAEIEASIPARIGLIS
jgi:hypothetical protein